MRSLVGAAVTAAVALASTSSALAAPPPGATPATAVRVAVGASAAVPTAGGAVWFRVTPPRPGTYVVDTAGTTFDAGFGFRTSGPPREDAPAVTTDERTTVPGATQSYPLAFERPDPTALLRIRPVTGGGIARLTVRAGAAPEDDWARPVPLDLARGAVAVASRAFAASALQPGEPGGPHEGQSVWWTVTAAHDGRLVLDTCANPVESTSPTPGVLRVLDDRPLGQAAVLAEATTDERGTCHAAAVVVRAGQVLRVQSTRRLDDLAEGEDRSVVLRARALGTPPTVTLSDGVGLCRSRRGCAQRIDVRAAPGAPIVDVACRLGRAAWRPCVKRVDGRRRTPVVPRGGSGRVEVRATDASGRQATAREQLLYGSF